jgi:FixJ family two-component response regulator
VVAAIVDRSDSIVQAAGSDEVFVATVHVVDDDDSFRVAVARLLKAAGHDVRVYASAGDFLISHRNDDVPGCLLLDVNMPGPSGLDLQTALAERGIGLPVIFVTGYGDVPSSVRAMKAGAVDFFAKPLESDSLLGAVAEAIARDTAQRSLVSRQRALQAHYEQLTLREREVLAHVIAGKLNKQIAADLGVSERTVKSHRAQVLAKMELDSLAELVRAAAELGLAPETRSPSVRAA